MAEAAQSGCRARIRHPDGSSFVFGIRSAAGDPQPFPPPAERSAGQGCAVVVVEQAVGDEASLRVQGPAGPAEQDLTARTHPRALPGPELLPQGTRLLPGPPGALPGQTPALVLRQLAPSLRAGRGTQR